MAARRLWRGALTALLSVLCLVGAPALGASLSEAEIKAGYIYNFALLTQWPSGAGEGAGLSICLLGEDPLDDALEGLVGKWVADEPITLRRVSDAAQAAHCRILVVAPAERERWRALLAGLDRRPVLTVGDHSGFAENGGIIEFLAVGKRLRFSVNLGAARAAGLGLSAQLLRLAHDVLGLEE